MLREMFEAGSREGATYELRVGGTVLVQGSVNSTRSNSKATVALFEEGQLGDATSISRLVLAHRKRRPR